MSTSKAPSVAVIARRLKTYVYGDKVKILRGRFAGKTMTVDQSANDWVMLKEMPRRDVMSKGNVEPVDGFSEEELTRAKRAAEKMREMEA